MISLQQVSMLEILTEYVNGDEYVRLDNVALSFTPALPQIVPPLYSEFDQGSFEGWTFVNTAGATVPASGGNPGGYVRINDLGGVTSQGYASTVFYGDWQMLNNTAALQMDLKIQNVSGTFSPTLDLIRLSGPGGVATIPMDSSLWEAHDQWRTFSYLLDQNRWTMVSGSWNGLLARVEEIQVNLEFIDGSEVICFDNFRLADSPPEVDFTADRQYIFLGDTIGFYDRSWYAPSEWWWSFGDGQHGTERDPRYRYQVPGDFSVSLRAENFFGSDSLTRSNFIHVQGISDSILYYDNFEDNTIHPAWRLINGTWEETGGMLGQTSNYYGIGTINGAFALTGSRLWSDYTASCNLMSLDNDKIGMAFHYQDARNFYLFTWQNEGSARFLIRFVNGQETTLASDAVAYQIGVMYQLKIVTDGPSIKCYINNGLVFDVMDSTFTSGKVALYCWGNQDSYYDNFTVTQTHFVSGVNDPPEIRTIGDYRLYQNYPNPFNPGTVISWQLKSGSPVKLTVFDITGKEVAVLVDTYQSPGIHRVEFDAAELVSGIYFYRLEAFSGSGTEYVETRKMIFLK